MGKTGRKNKKYSAEFKIHVIMDMRDNHLGNTYITTTTREFLSN